jgi:hypothetical protein
MASRLIAVIALLMLPSWLPAKEKAPKTYPLHGTVIAMRTERTPINSGVYTDAYGKTRGGGSVVQSDRVYRVRTVNMDYDIQAGRGPALTIGRQLDFRIEKNSVFVREGTKERKFRLVGQEKRE